MIITNLHRIRFAAQKSNDERTDCAFTSFVSDVDSIYFPINNINIRVPCEVHGIASDLLGIHVNIDRIASIFKRIKIANLMAICCR